MQCECVTRVRGLIEKRIKESMPEGSTGLHWDFQAIRMGITDSGIVYMPVFDIKGEYQAPKKSGGMKKVKVDTFIASTYCPFCGIKCKPDKADA